MDIVTPVLAAVIMVEMIEDGAEIMVITKLEMIITIQILLINKFMLVHKTICKKEPVGPFCYFAICLKMPPALAYSKICASVKVEQSL